MYPIVDLHCDLLMYLCHKPGRSPEDSASRCSSIQLRKGGVALQTLAIYAPTGPSSIEQGRAQIEWFAALTTQYPAVFGPYRGELDPARTQLIAAFENASAFASEEESLASSFARLERYQTMLGPIFYISLTWNGENRFGGGAGASCGLKPDGKELLGWMSGRKIAVDLSHTSDRLAEEILNEIDAKGLQIPVLASHSNFRKVVPSHSRNLPDALAKEIIRRKGLIGLNFFAPFLGKTLAHQVEYGLALGAEDALCFGADFFCDADFSDLLQKYGTAPFQPESADASCFPQILETLSSQVSSKILQNISSLNALKFLETALEVPCS